MWFNHSFIVKQRIIVQKQKKARILYLTTSSLCAGVILWQISLQEIYDPI